MRKWQIRRPVMAATAWASNAEMVRDMARLRYLRKDWFTLDPTYGKGNWWKLWTPNNLIPHDLYKLDGVDFRELPEDNNTFDAITYDPPYVSVGGRKTTGIAKMHDAFGLTNAPTTPLGLQLLINDGLTEMSRVCVERGLILVKCQPYVSSGKLWNGAYEIEKHARETLHLIQLDRFEHIGNPRPQPRHKKKSGLISPQQHARRNHSTLLVFQVPKAKKPGRNARASC